MSRFGEGFRCNELYLRIKVPMNRTLSHLMLLCMFACVVIGCGSSTETSAVKQDELKQFLQENPQLAEPSNLSE